MIALYTAIAVTVVYGACNGTITTKSTIADCSSSPCATTEYSPAYQGCTASLSDTGQACVYGTNTYITTVKTYTNGECWNSQCQGASYSSTATQTNKLPELKNCGG